MYDRPVLAHDPNLDNTLLAADIVDDPVHVRRLILEHGETRAFGDHFGKLSDVTDCRIEQMRAMMLGDKHDECHHGHRQGHRQVKADFQLQGFGTHCLRVSRVNCRKE